MDATTVTYVKDLLEITSATHDTVLGRMVSTVSQRIEDFIDRPLESAARTEEYSIKPRQDVLFLRAYPVASITSIKIATNWDFAAVSAVASTDYHTDSATGSVHFNFYPLLNYMGDNAKTAPQAIQVVYTGGLATTPANLQANYPAISSACETQVIAMWRRRDEPTTKMTKIGDYGSAVEGPLSFLPDVVEALMPYRRMRFGQ